MKGALPWLVRWARRAGTSDFYPALAALVSTIQNIFFLTLHYFNLCVFIAQQHGKAIEHGRLSLNVSPVEVPEEGGHDQGGGGGQDLNNRRRGLYGN
jgi:hypothetical protein